ncbi:MAG: hypothetical protein CMJ67_04845 [Planctomycetaceae bacterium]|nr:hypothetical protein [Planctomycetaceae bacterium]
MRPGHRTRAFQEAATTSWPARREETDPNEDESKRIPVSRLGGNDRIRSFGSEARTMSGPRVLQGGDRHLGSKQLPWPLKDGFQ